MLSNNYFDVEPVNYVKRIIKDTLKKQSKL